MPFYPSTRRKVAVFLRNFWKFIVRNSSEGKVAAQPSRLKVLYNKFVRRDRLGPVALAPQRFEVMIPRDDKIRLSSHCAIHKLVVIQIVLYHSKTEVWVDEKNVAVQDGRLM